MGMKRNISIGVLSILVSSLLTALPSAANADELSDARDSLASSQARLSSLQTSLANVNQEISSWQIKISASDTSTADGQTNYTSFLVARDAAIAAKSVIEPQIVPLQSDVAALTIRIATLIATINAANNCPADWGLTPGSFSDGLETGVFSYNAKVATELFKDQRNIVVTSAIQFSKDGNVWNTYRHIPANTWLNYALNYGKVNPKSSYYMKYTFIGDVYELLRNSGSQVRVSTVLEKQGCVSHTVTTDSKNLTIAQISFTKSTIDELYVTYPQAFPNYQIRDQAKAAVASVAIDFPASAGSGSQYNFSRGGLGYFEIVTFPRGGGCTGDFNNVSVNIGTSCELGIYWLWNNKISFVDSVSTIGGSSALQKQQIAMLQQAKALQLVTNKILLSYEAVGPQIQALNQRYSGDWSKAGQPAMDQYTAIYNNLIENSAAIANYRQEMYTIRNSQYVNNEIAVIIGDNDSQIKKYGSVFESSLAQVKSSIAQVQQYLNTPSSGAANELIKSTGSKAQASKDASVANSHLSEISGFAGKADYQKNYKEYFAKYYPVVINAMNSATNQFTNLNQSLNTAKQNQNNSLNQVDVQAWANVVANYSAAISSYSTTMKVLAKAISILKSSPGVQNEGIVEIDTANEFLASVVQTLFNVEEQLKRYPAIVKAKGLSSDPQLRASESAGLKSMIDKYMSEAKSVESRRDNASKRGNAGESDSQDWLKAAAIYASVSSQYIRISKSYTQMLGILQSDSSSALTPNPNDSIFVDLDGEEEVAAGSVSYKKDKQGRYLIKVTSNQGDTDITVKAIKSRSKAIIFNITTDADGNLNIRTSRKLSGYVLQLVLDGEILSNTAKLK